MRLFPAYWGLSDSTAQCTGKGCPGIYCSYNFSILYIDQCMLDRQHSNAKTLRLVNEVPTLLSITGGLCFCIIMMPFDHHDIAIHHLNYWALSEKNVASCLNGLRFSG